jgi:hypothetical protein
MKSCATGLRDAVLQSDNPDWGARMLQLDRQDSDLRTLGKSQHPGLQRKNSRCQPEDLESRLKGWRLPSGLFGELTALGLALKS